jgi:hypothetical protein
MEYRRPKYGMVHYVCRLLESCQAKSTFIENKIIFVRKMTLGQGCMVSA